MSDPLATNGNKHRSQRGKITAMLSQHSIDDFRVVEKHSMEYPTIRYVTCHRSVHSPMSSSTEVISSVKLGFGSDAMDRSQTKEVVVVPRLDFGQLAPKDVSKMLVQFLDSNNKCGRQLLISLWSILEEGDSMDVFRPQAAEAAVQA